MSDAVVVSPISSQTEMAISNAETVGVMLSEARRRLPSNILSNMSWLTLNMMVGLWYTPYLIAHLGVAVYGLIPLASSITHYLALLTDGFDGAMSRFLMIELARNDSQAANRTFNTAILGGLTISLLLVPIAYLASRFVPLIFHVPAGYEVDSQWLVLLTMLAFATTFFSGSFAISSFASHRFDLRLYVNIVRLTVQMGSMVLLFILVSPKLWAVGTGILMSALCALLGHGVLWRRLTPQLKIRPRLFDITRLKQMLQFSGWVLVNQAGVQLFLNIDLVVANLVFGAQVAGRYGAVLLFPVLLRTLVGTIGSVLEPIVFTFYANNNLIGLARFCRLSVKFIGLAIALPIGILCGLAKPLLALWLGPDYSDLSWLVVALVGHLCVNLAVVPLFPIQEATNKVRVPGILTLVMGVANTGLAVALAKWSGWGYISIAIAGAIMLTAKNTLFTPLYAARIIELPWYTFIPSLLTGILGFVTVGAVSFLGAASSPSMSWGQLALIVASISGGYLIAAYFLGLNSGDRKLLETEIRRRFMG